ncbi:hypothetical protein [Hymenobacter properus]|uniref:DUF4168 domain-containing protein n=1 Tax=Hymenobacter properus TaxID=2791026 RepID=A0A931BDH4_9BACT|nr:hypothetical protein [Hymenobacter properus]MBF9141819.1 hypothetical protein [Hymenobacter properus]MBR7720627.1 hypothetical protein [Microvirga sp. SRT04]
MRASRLSLLLSLSLTAASCSIFHRNKPAPVVETVRTADSPAPPTAARDLADVMGTELKLTPDQTGRVRTILNGTLAESNAAKEKFAPKSPQLIAELKRINTKSQRELSAVVGPAKFKQLQTKATQQKIATEMQQRQK